MDIQPVHASRTAEGVASRIRALIHSGELPVGSRLPSQRDLAAILGVGRTSVREGLAHLEAEGYLATRRGAAGGSFILEPSTPSSVWIELLRANLADLEDLLDFRAGIEMRIAELAAVRRSATDVAAMRQAIAELPIGSQASPAFREADGRFHAALAHASGSSRLAEASRNARAELFMPMDNAPYEQRVEVTRVQHARIADAVESRNPDGAVAAVREHIEQSRSQLRAIVGVGR